LQGTVIEPPAFVSCRLDGETIDSILETCINKVEESIYDLESPTQLGNQNATPEFTLSMIEKAHTASTEFELALLQYLRPSSEVNQVEAIRSALILSQTLSDVLGNAKGITRLAKKDEDAEDIIRHAKSSAVATQEFFTNVTSARLGGLSAEGSIKAIERSNEAVQASMERLAKSAELLIPKNNQLDPSKMDLGDMVENEMSNAARTIEEATARLQALMAKPKNDGLSAIELQVNASILESAMAMMQAIGHLIKCATISQQEVVAQGRGTSTNAAFYKKNNRWTEGLISAAKAVAVATTLLVETADGVISKTHSMEQLLESQGQLHVQGTRQPRASLQGRDGSLAGFGPGGEGHYGTGDEVSRKRGGLPGYERARIQDQGDGTAGRNSEVGEGADIGSKGIGRDEEGFLPSRRRLSGKKRLGACFLKMY